VSNVETFTAPLTLVGIGRKCAGTGGDGYEPRNPCRTVVQPTAYSVVLNIALSG